jgi:hypothetical protein
MMLVLSVFNSDDDSNRNNNNNQNVSQGTMKSYEEIRAATNLPHTLLKEALFSLSCVPHQKLLIKVPDNVDSISTSDRFALNENFVTTKKKIRMRMVRFRESIEEKKSANVQSEG